MNLQNFCLFEILTERLLSRRQPYRYLAFNLKERLNLINYNFINMSAPALWKKQNLDGIDTNKLDKEEIVLNKIKDTRLSLVDGFTEKKIGFLMIIDPNMQNYLIFQKKIIIKL